MEHAWVSVADLPPPQGEVVLTKIHDAAGERNVAPLKLSGRLWFMPAGDMYVYYAPTHWKRQ